jgi:ketosteroid isomerase-like protein
MKYCPQCQTTYTDDLLRFCLQDGTPLKEVLQSEIPVPNVSFGEEETIISSRQVEPIRVPVQNPPSQNWQQQQYQNEPPIIAVQPEKRKSRTGLIVGLTVLGMLLLAGIAGTGALIYMKNRKTEVAVNVNNAPSSNRQTSAANVQAVNQNSNQNLNANIANASPSATATPKSTLNPQAAKLATEEVKNVVDEWKSATENLDIDTHMEQYAETVDYYKAGRVGQARVRADKQRAYDQYSSVNIDISNLKITPDETGTKATALFDKEWTFEGDEKSSSGKVQQQLTFSKIGDRWLITSERDLRVYYVNN